MEGDGDRVRTAMVDLCAAEGHVELVVPVEGYTPR